MLYKHAKERMRCSIISCAHVASVSEDGRPLCHCHSIYSEKKCRQLGICDRCRMYAASNEYTGLDGCKIQLCDKCIRRGLYG